MQKITLDYTEKNINIKVNVKRHWGWDTELPEKEIPVYDMRFHFKTEDAVKTSFYIGRVQHPPSREMINDLINAIEHIPSGKYIAAEESEDDSDSEDILDEISLDGENGYYSILIDNRYTITTFHSKKIQITIKISHHDTIFLLAKIVDAIHN